MVIYGSGYCGNCGGGHDGSRHLRETGASRMALMKILMSIQFDIMLNRPSNQARVAANNWNLPAVPGQTTTMFGILITPHERYAAQSGPILPGQRAFLDRAQAMGFRVCPVRNVPGMQHRTVMGVDIDAAAYNGTRTAYPPGACAAPRLIEEAAERHNQNGWNINIANWAMSEVMYQPGQVGNWTHGLTAESCRTCAKLVPMLLCDAGAMGGLEAINL